MVRLFESGGREGGTLLHVHIGVNLENEAKHPIWVKREKEINESKKGGRGGKYMGGSIQHEVGATLIHDSTID